MHGVYDGARSIPHWPSAHEMMLPSLAGRLQAADRQLAKLKATYSQPLRGSVQQMMPRLVDEYRALVDDLAESLRSVNIDRARAEMRKLIGDIQVNATPDEIRLETREGAVETRLIGRLHIEPNSGSGGRMAFAANAVQLVSAPLSDATHRGASA